MLSGCVPGASSLPSQVRARHKAGKPTDLWRRRSAAPVCAVARGVEQSTHVLQLQQQDHHTTTVCIAEGTPISCAAATAPVQHQQQHLQQQQQHLQQLRAVDVQHQQQLAQHIQHAVLPAAAWEPGGFSHVQPDQLVIVQQQQQQQVAESAPAGSALERFDLQHCHGHCNGTHAAAAAAGHTAQFQHMQDQQQLQQQHVHQAKQQDCSCVPTWQQQQQQKLPTQQQPIKQQQASNKQRRNQPPGLQLQQQQLPTQQQQKAKRQQASSSSTKGSRRSPGLREFRVANSTQPENLAASLGVYLKQHQVKHSKRQQQQHQVLQQPAAADGSRSSSETSESWVNVPDVLLCCTSKVALHTALQALAVACHSAAQLQQPYQLLLQPQLLQEPVAQAGSASSSNSSAGRLVTQYQLQLSWLPLQQQPQTPQVLQQGVAQQAVLQQQQQQLAASCQLLQCDHLASPVPSSSSTKAPKHRKQKHKPSVKAAAGDGAAGPDQQDSSSSSSMFQPAAANLYQLEWQLYGALKGAWPTGLCFSNAAGALAAFKALIGVRSRLAAAGGDLFVSAQRADSAGSSSSSSSSSAVVLWATSVPAAAAVQRQPAVAAAASVSAAVPAERLPGLPAVEQQVKAHRRVKKKLWQQQQQQGVGMQQPTQQSTQRPQFSRQHQQQGWAGSEVHALEAQQQQQQHMQHVQASHVELQHSSMHSPSLLPELQDIAAAAAGDSHPGSPPIQPASSGKRVTCQQHTNGKACHAGLAVPVAAVPVPPGQLQPLC